MPCWCRRRIRQIALNAATIALLRSVPRDPTTPYLFRTRLIGLFYPWNRIRRRAGPPDVRLRDLRHSFASFLVNRGMSLYGGQDLLGHTQRGPSSVTLIWLDKPYWTLLRWFPALSAVPRLAPRSRVRSESPARFRGL